MKRFFEGTADQSQRLLSPDGHLQPLPITIDDECIIIIVSVCLAALNAVNQITNGDRCHD